MDAKTVVLALVLFVTQSTAAAPNDPDVSTPELASPNAFTPLLLDEEETSEPSAEEQKRPSIVKEAPAVRARRKPPPPGAPTVSLSLGLIQDAAFVSGEDVCTAESQISGRYLCVRRSGSQYHGTPLPDDSGRVPPGIRFATTRVTIGSFVALGEVSLGARVGWAFAGRGPQPDGGKAFLPLQAEGQAAYWLTGDAFSQRGVGAFVLASTGIAQVDGKTSVNVRENAELLPPASQIDNPPAQELDAYQRAGPGFAGLGLGLFLPFGGASGLLTDLRGVALFPTPGVALSLAASVAFGL